MIKFFRYILICIVLIAAADLTAQTNITFRVNMSEETVSPDGVFLAGSFNGFSTTATPMNSAGNGIYEVEVGLVPDSVFTYKFVNGNVFELITTACGTDDGNGNINRSIDVPGAASILPVVCFGSCENCPADPVTVTFRVSMSGQTVSGEGVKLAGSFNGFSTTATPMTNMGGGFYQAAVSLNPGAYVTYKFVNGTEFELVSNGCGVDDGSGNINRSYSVPAVNATVPAPCFGTCTNCEIVIPQVNLTFRVNMTNETVSPDGVFLAGSFNGFSATANPMTHIGSNIYETTVQLPQASVITYKFVNGDQFELVSSDCGVNDGSGNINRSFTVPAVNAAMATRCFGSCTDCEEEQLYAITFRVNMSNQPIDPAGVFLSGSFNGFSTTANQLTNTGNGIYETTIQLAEDAIVTYKFVNGTTYETVGAECGTDNGSGIINRSFAVPSEDSTLNVVCFGECSDCEIAELSGVTFRVNMSNEAVDPGGVFLSGSFNGFSTTANQLTNTGNGIYETTIQLAEDAILTYKFVNGTSYEIVGAECGTDNGSGIINRSFTVPSEDSTLNIVCFGECSDCELQVPVTITFRVNMSNEPVSGDGVFLAGSFNGFSATENEMTAVGNGIYETAVGLTSGEAVTYKFVNGTDYEEVPAACGINDGSGNINRGYTVPAISAAIPAVCFGTCTSCTGAPAVQVRFRVNMSNETVSGDGVKLAGSFNGFSATANQMTATGNGIYEATLLLPVDSAITYKFVNGTAYELINGDCGLDDGNGNINRSLVIGSSDTTLPLVCFNSCEDCIVAPTVNVTFQVDMSEQEVDPSGVFIAGSFNGFSTTANPLTDAGNTIYQAVIALTPATNVTYKFLNGADWEEVTGLCTADDGNGNINRSLSILSSDFTTPVSCFGSCGVCLTTSASEAVPEKIPAIYPNPATTIITLKNAQHSTLKIYSVEGKLLRTFLNVASTTLIDISGIPSGIYIIATEEKEASHFTRLIKY